MKLFWLWIGPDFDAKEKGRWASVTLYFCFFLESILCVDLSGSFVCIHLAIEIFLFLLLTYFSLLCRFQIKKKRAQTTEVKLPWDTTIGSELLPASAAGEIVKKLHQQGSSDLVISTGKTAGNFYWRLEPSKVQTDRIPRPPVVVDFKKQQSSNQQVNKEN